MYDTQQTPSGCVYDVHGAILSTKACGWSRYNDWREHASQHFECTALHRREYLHQVLAPFLQNLHLRLHFQSSCDVLQCGTDTPSSFIAHTPMK